MSGRFEARRKRRAAERTLVAIALEWGRAIRYAPTDSDMDELDGRLFDACGEIVDAIDGPLTAEEQRALDETIVFEANPEEPPALPVRVAATDAPGRN